MVPSHGTFNCLQNNTRMILQFSTFFFGYQVKRTANVDQRWLLSSVVAILVADNQSRRRYLTESGLATIVCRTPPTRWLAPFAAHSRCISLPTNCSPSVIYEPQIRFPNSSSHRLSRKVHHRPLDALNERSFQFESNEKFR